METIINNYPKYKLNYLKWSNLTIAVELHGLNSKVRFRLAY